MAVVYKGQHLATLLHSAFPPLLRQHSPNLMGFSEAPARAAMRSSLLGILKRPCVKSFIVSVSCRKRGGKEMIVDGRAKGKS